MISAMTLKINTNWKIIVSRVFWTLVIVALAVFFIRTAIWEKHYYDEKEGSVRVVAVSSEEEIEVDETEVTTEEKKEYVVAADRPRYLSIEKLGIVNARILSLGLNASGALMTPISIFDAGWYNASGKPGQGGTMVLDGHNGGPTKVGIFKYLPSLVKGDIIKVERGDGAVFAYSVVENTTVPLDESDAYMATAMKSPVEGKESISIISCTGDWSSQRKTYLSRQFTRAVITE